MNIITLGIISICLLILNVIVVLFLIEVKKQNRRKINELYREISLSKIEKVEPQAFGWCYQCNDYSFISKDGLAGCLHKNCVHYMGELKWPVSK